MAFKKAIAILSVTLAVLAFAGAAQARDLIVGGAEFGWTHEKPDETTMNYTDWEIKNPLYIGDTVWFQYVEYYHEVSIFNSFTDYDACDYDNNIRVANMTAGAVDNGAGVPKGWGYTIPDNKARYFGCLVYGHCEAGQKVKIQATLGKAPPGPVRSPPKEPPIVLSPPLVKSPPKAAEPPPKADPPSAASGLRWFQGVSLIVGASLLALLA